MKTPKVKEIENSFKIIKALKESIIKRIHEFRNQDYPIITPDTYTVGQPVYHRIAGPSPFVDTVEVEDDNKNKSDDKKNKLLIEFYNENYRKIIDYIPSISNGVKSEFILNHPNPTLYFTKIDTTTEMESLNNFKKFLKDNHSDMKINNEIDKIKKFEDIPLILRNKIDPSLFNKSYSKFFGDGGGMDNMFVHMISNFKENIPKFNKAYDHFASIYKPKYWQHS